MVTDNTRSSNNKSILIKHVIQSSHWLAKSKVYQKARDKGYSYISFLYFRTIFSHLDASDHLLYCVLSLKNDLVFTLQSVT